jgi:hypothetical protein
LHKVRGDEGERESKVGERMKERQERGGFKVNKN